MKSLLFQSCILFVITRFYPSFIHTPVPPRAPLCAATRDTAEKNGVILRKIRPEGRLDLKKPRFQQMHTVFVCPAQLHRRGRNAGRKKPDLSAKNQAKKERTLRCVPAGSVSRLRSPQLLSLPRDPAAKRSPTGRRGFVFSVVLLPEVGVTAARISRRRRRGRTRFWTNSHWDACRCTHGR